METKPFDRYGIWRRLPERFRWTAHNLIGHPGLELFSQLGLPALGRWIHDVTLPEVDPEEEADNAV